MDGDTLTAGANGVIGGALRNTRRDATSTGRVAATGTKRSTFVAECLLGA